MEMKNTEAEKRRAEEERRYDEFQREQRQAMTTTHTSGDSVAAPTISDLTPSYFASLGSPSCSRWGKSEFEWIALAYVQALANDGDTWKPLTRDRCYELLTDEQKRHTHSQLTYEGYQYRFDAVAAQITDAEGAVGVGGYWRRAIRSAS